VVACDVQIEGDHLHPRDRAFNECRPTLSIRIVGKLDPDQEL
jgi:hypothetical protein